MYFPDCQIEPTDSNLTIKLTGPANSIAKVKDALTIVNKSVRWQLKELRGRLVDLRKWGGDPNHVEFTVNKIKELQEYEIEELFCEREDYLLIPSGFYYIAPNSSNFMSNTEVTPFYLPHLRDYQREAVGKLLEYRRGTLSMTTGCHARGQKIIMFDGTLKAVEDVTVGDLLMGPNSTPRKVSKLCRGRQKMARISPTKGEPFVVNVDHILSLEVIQRKDRRVGPNQIINITVSEYLKKSKFFKHMAKLYRPSIINFNNINKELEIPPYILGLWLGDGNSNHAGLTSMDAEIANEWAGWVKHLGCKISVSHKPNNKAKTYNAVIDGDRSMLGLSRGTRLNLANTNLEKINVLKNKHIPHWYKTASFDDRVQLIAGLIDTDGHLDNNTFDYVSINKNLAHDMAFVCRSVGLYVKISKCKKGCQTGVIGTYYRLIISGDLSIIPCRLPRKQATKRAQIKSVLRTGLSVELLPEDDFFGFELDNDHLYLLEDFTVTHNSGKSLTITSVVLSLIKAGKRVMVVVPSDYLVGQLYDTISKHHDSVTCAGGGRKPKLGQDVLVVTAQSAIGYASSYQGLIIDECLPYNQRILTNQGAVPIGTLYNKWEAKEPLPLVASFNEKTKQVEYKEITHAWRREVDKPLVEIKTSRLKTRCTPDHLVLTDAGWKPAKEITTGDNLIGNIEKGEKHQRMSVDKLSEDYQSLIIGSYLGDGGLQRVNKKVPSKYRISFIHGDKQKEYLFWKAKAFERVESVQFIEKNGYAQTPAWQFNTLVMDSKLNFFDVGPKTCDQGVVDLIDAKCLAIWFMDDGSVSHKSQTAVINSNAFDYETNLRLQAKLMSMGIETFVSTTKKTNGTYCYLRMNSSGYRALMNTIRSYVPACMSYKVDVLDPNSDNNWSFIKEPYSLYTVESVKQISYERKKHGEGHGLFDLEIKDNHNFITSANGSGNTGAGVVLHNCHHAGASTWQDIGTSNPDIEYVYSCSATPFRTDGLDLMITAITGPIRFEYGVRRAIAEGWLSKPKIYMVNIRQDFQLGKKTMRVVAYKKLMQDPKVLDFIRDKAVNALAQGEKVIVLFRTVVAGKLFRKHCGEDLTFDVASGTFKKPLHAFAKGETNILVACDKLIAEGLDIPDASVLIVATQHSSAIITYQSVGRVLRKSEGKDGAVVIDITADGYDQFKGSAIKRLEVYRQICDDVFRINV